MLCMPRHWSNDIFCIYWKKAQVDEHFILDCTYFSLSVYNKRYGIASRMTEVERFQVDVLIGIKWYMVTVEHGESQTPKNTK